MPALKMEIILHYFYSGEDYEGGGCAATEFIEGLITDGILEIDDDDWSDKKYRLSDKGRFYVEYILSLPYPVKTYRIPLEDL